MPKTLRGVYHNLKESEYTVSNGEAVLFFSSEHLLNKFLGGYQSYRKTCREKLSKNFNMNILNIDTLSDITFYQLVEKRGFLVWVAGSAISYEDSYKYSLRDMLEPDSPEWKRIKKPTIKQRLKQMNRGVNGV